MKIILVTLAILNLLISSKAFPTLGEHQLKAPLYAAGQRSPEEIGGNFQGDILVKLSASGVPVVKAITTWPSKTVPYVIEARFNTNDLNLIKAGMAEISAKTCVKFVARTTETDYVNFRSLSTSGCSSNIGKIGGMQYITLLSSTDNPSSNCFNVGKGTVIHEIMHALGLYHMQSAPDRDSFVTINFANIISTATGNFAKADASNFLYYTTTYDYPSIMHYGRNFFSTNGADTITTLNTAMQTVIGQRTQMSAGDIMRINKMYTCPEASPCG